MLSGNYEHTKYLLAKLRKEKESRSCRQLSPSPTPLPKESQVISRGVGDYVPSYQPYISRYDKPNQNEHSGMNHSRTIERKKQAPQQRASSNVSTKSLGFIPEYKYVGKCEKKLYCNKPDLRFDITDINQKKRKFKYSFERENPRDREKLLKYLKAQNLDKYSKELPERPICEKVDYCRKTCRPEESGYMDENPNHQSYLIHQNNSTYKRIDQMKLMLKKEAHNLIEDNVVICRTGSSKTPNKKRGNIKGNTMKLPNKSFR